MEGNGLLINIFGYLLEYPFWENIPYFRNFRAQNGVTKDPEEIMGEVQKNNIVGGEHIFWVDFKIYTFF